MKPSIASLEYRQAAIQQASAVGLVIALHDTLMGNLRRAAEAIDRGDIQRRCDELIHAFKVLQQLGAMLDMEKGGETAIKIKRFYTHVHSQILLAQFKLSAAILRRQIEIVLDVRGAWQQLDSSAIESQSNSMFDDDVVRPPAMHASLEEARTSFSCSF